MGFILLLILSGCGDDSITYNTSTEAETNSEMFEEVASKNIYHIMRDKNTDVLYLVANDTYEMAISVMMESDGTPLTYEELKKEI